MAERRAIASGNYNNPAIWDSGLGVPGAADIVRANGFVVTFTADATASMFSNAVGGAAANGGSFRTATHGLTITGDWFFGTGGAYVPTAAGLTTTFIGNVLNTPTATNGGGGLVFNQNAATVNWVGDAYGGTGLNCLGILFQSSSGIFNFTGNAYATSAGGGNNWAISIVAPSSISTLNGNFYASLAATYTSGALSVSNNSTTVTINGGAIGANNSGITCFAIGITGNPNVVIDYAECSPQGNHPIAGAIKYRNASPTFKIVKADNSFVTLVDPSSIANYLPAPQDVRKDTLYAAGDREGTLAVPPKASVVIGVPTDDGVGTLNPSVDITGLSEQLLDYLQNSNHPMAEKYREMSTKSTVATQIQTALS